MTMTSRQIPNPKKVAILLENQFGDLEFQIPFDALQKAEAKVVVLGSRMNDTYQSYRKEFEIPDLQIGFLIEWRLF
jgi:protease I